MLGQTPQGVDGSPAAADPLVERVGDNQVVRTGREFAVAASPLNLLPVAGSLARRAGGENDDSPPWLPALAGKAFRVRGSGAIGEVRVGHVIH